MTPRSVVGDAGVGNSERSAIRNQRTSCYWRPGVRSPGALLLFARQTERQGHRPLCRPRRGSGRPPRFGRRPGLARPPRGQVGAIHGVRRTFRHGRWLPRRHRRGPPRAFGLRSAGLGSLDGFSAGTRLRLSLGRFRLAPGNLRRDGGLARLFLLPSLALGGRFTLWLIGMGVRQMHRQVQDLEATMRASHGRRRALDRSSSVARDIGTPPDTRRACHDRAELGRVDNAFSSALQAIWIGASAAAGALGWMIRFHNHQPLLVANPSVHRNRLDVFRVV